MSKNYPREPQPDATFYVRTFENWQTRHDSRLPGFTGASIPRGLEPVNIILPSVPTFRLQFDSRFDKLPSVIVDTATAGKRLNLSANRVRQLIREKRLPAKQLGPCYYLDTKDLARFVPPPRGRPKKERSKPNGKRRRT